MVDTLRLRRVKHDVEHRRIVGTIIGQDRSDRLPPLTEDENDLLDSAVSPFDPAGKIVTLSSRDAIAYKSLACAAGGAPKNNVRNHLLLHNPGQNLAIRLCAKSKMGMEVSTKAKS